MTCIGTALAFLLGYKKLCRQRNVNISKRLKVQTIVEEIQTHRKSWKEHVQGMQARDNQNQQLNANRWEYKVEVVPPKNGKTSFWKRIEGYRVNKPS
jgi:hypothetical protein